MTETNESSSAINEKNKTKKEIDVTVLFDCSPPRFTGYVYPSHIVKHIYLFGISFFTTSSFSW